MTDFEIPADIADKQRRRLEKLRAAVQVGTEITVQSLGGNPLRTASVTAKHADGNFMLDDGTAVEWWEINREGDRWGPSGGWKIVNYGAQEGFSIRPAMARDEEIAAMLQGRWLPNGTIEPKDAPRKPVPLREFTGRSVRTWKGRLQTSAGTPVDDIAEAVLPGADYGVLLAYMLRRFGPPTMGSDEYKCLSGAWLLRTPDDRIYIQVSPSVNGVSFSFRQGVNDKVLWALHEAQESWTDYLYGRTQDVAACQPYLDLGGPLYRAVRVALLDLLRPVGIRDSAINIEGLVEDDSVRTVKASPLATIGFPVELMAGEEWFDLLDAVRKLHRSPKQALKLAAANLKGKTDKDSSKTLA